MQVLITGANRGIGAALRHGYLERGADVTGTRRSSAAAPGWVPLDVTDPGMDAALKTALADTALDLLVCNAGVYLDKDGQLNDSYAPDLWSNSFAVNVTGVFRTIRAALPAIRRGGGRIAILSSQMASHILAPGGSYAYRASKAAVLNLGRNLATDLAPDGIAVGIYHPGWVVTEMGGADADLTVDAAAAGLIQRFDALSLATTGEFLTWDGRPHPY